MAHLEIRDALPDDAKVMAQIRVASKRFAYREFVPASYLDSREHEVEVLREVRDDFAAARPGGRGHLAFFEGVPVGMSWIEHGEHGYYEIPEGHAKLASLFVAPAAIGTGVGRTLFWHALDALAQEGFREACLMTYAPNVRARGFYEAMGWRFDGYRQTRDVDWPQESFSIEGLRYRGATRPGAGG